MRVLLVQRTLDPPGGGNAVAAWMLQALAGTHELTTLTERPWDPGAVDAFYGTSLASARVAQRHLRGLARHVPTRRERLHTLRMAMLFRAAFDMADDFDRLITADNYAAFKRPGLQYLHFPAPLYPTPTRLAPLVRAYYRCCDWLSHQKWESARQNRTLANSQWTAGHLARDCGITAHVLYPPVVDPGPGLGWEDRSDTFLSVARFHGSKRLELIVSIVERVRAALPDATLVFVGSDVDAAYTARLERLAAARPWIRIERDLPQARVFALMQRSRFGIHAMAREHFGMSAAEMARAGCLVFAHNSGGIIEVLNGEPELLWDDADEAVQRILTLAANPQRQQQLSARLIAHARQFSTERFMREFREAVAAEG